MPPSRRGRRCGTCGSGASAAPAVAALALALLAPRLGSGGGGAAPAFGSLSELDLVERQVAVRRVEAEAGEGVAEMLGKVGGDVDAAAVGVVDPEAPGVEVELAADR